MNKLRQTISLSLVAVIIALAVFALMAMDYNAQDEITYPFRCLDEFEQWHELEARNIWIGYAQGGWDVGDDVRLIWRYNNEYVDTFRIYRSDERNEYYVLTYNARPEQEPGKLYLSWHPCGQGAITEAQYMEIVGE